MLTELTISAFKAFQNAEVRLGPMVILIGPNDSGKSSILEAVQLLGQLAREDLDRIRDLSDPERFSALLCAYAKESAVRLRVRLETRRGPEATWSVGLALSSAGSVKVMHEELHVGESIYEWDGKRTRGRSTDDHVRKDDTPSRGTLLMQLAERHCPEAEEVAQSLGATQLYRLDPLRMAEPASIIPGRRPILAYDGSGLAAVLDFIRDTHPESFERIEAELRRNIPYVERILFRSEWVQAGADLGGHPGKALAFRLAGTTKEIPAAHASDGALLLLGYLVVTADPLESRHILLEEPENGIHPSRLREVVQFLRALSRGDRGPASQCLVTTHSPYLLDWLTPDEVRVCRRRSEGGSEVHGLRSDLSPKEALLGELWTALTEDGLVGEDCR